MVLTRAQARLQAGAVPEAASLAAPPADARICINKRGVAKSKALSTIPTALHRQLGGAAGSAASALTAVLLAWLAALMAACGKLRVQRKQPTAVQQAGRPSAVANTHEE